MRKWGLALLVLFGLAGCASDAPPPPTQVVLEFKAAADMNATPDGQGAPARLRYYELKASTGFVSADFFALSDQAQATLGADLVAQDEVLLTPGQTVTRTRVLDANTKLLGFAVAYRDIDKAKWREAVEITPAQTTHLVIDVGAKSLSVSTAK